MQLKDYVEDNDFAVATEIYNAKCDSVEDIVVLMQKIAGEKAKFDDIICEFNCTLYNIKVCLSNLVYYKQRLKKFYEFKNSHIANLIEAFIANNTEDGLYTIKEDIKRSNDFDVHIIPKWKQGDRERAYGFTYNECFHIGYTNTYYTFDNWDINEDIQNVQSHIEECEENIQKWLDKKEQMYDEYGFDALIIVFSKFEKDNGPMQADDNWVGEKIIEDYKDYCEIY